MIDILDPITVLWPFQLEAFTPDVVEPASLCVRAIRLIPALDADLVIMCQDQVWRGTELEMPTPRFYIDSDMLVHCNALMNREDREFIVSGTVTAELLTAIDGSTVAGSAISLAYRAGSDGDWWGQMPYTVALTHGTTYWLKVSAVSGAARRAWRLPIVAEYANLSN